MYAPPGLEILYAILTDSQITPENITRSRDIIHREAGGKPSIVENWYRELGMGRSGSELAHDRLVEGTSYACSSIETADDISRTDILEAYENYYVASNMTLYCSFQAVDPAKFQPPGMPTTCRYFCSQQFGELTESN